MEVLGGSVVVVVVVGVVVVVVVVAENNMRSKSAKNFREIVYSNFYL